MLESSVHFTTPVPVPKAKASSLHTSISTVTDPPVQFNTTEISKMTQEVASITPPEEKNATKEKLLAVIGDGTLEQLMRERARIRKEKDEHSIAELRIILSSLENALTVETKRRLEMTKSIEQECQKQILEVTAKLEKAIELKSQTFQKRLSSLEVKVDELANRIEEQVSIIPKDIQKLSKELKESIQSIQEEYKHECNNHKTHCDNMQRQIYAYEEYTTMQMEKERSIREGTISDLKNTLEVQEKNRRDVDTKFQSLVDTELSILKEKLSQESSERKMEDDEIVDGLNIYTEKLQSTLALMADKY